MLSKIEKEILTKLSFNTTPTYKRLKISKEEYLITLKKMESDDEYINVQWIQDGIFKGEPGKIAITDKGERILKESTQGGVL
ncbi:hypothetical protein [Enterococcus sp.]|uniref:hypothetical protein n=1 Tax=Enterococcus sp. TaxID=35783 RepID=UPI003C75B42E